MLRVVIDANVWVSALLTPGIGSKLVDRLKQEQFQLVYSNESLQELLIVLARPKFTGKFEQAHKEELVALIEQRGTLITLEAPVARVSRDPKDDAYLACAQASDSDLLVTGDRDLLVLSQHGRTRIVSPLEFLQILQNTV